MMKGLKIFQLSAVYLFRYRRRYFFLFLALMFGFGIVTVITSIKDGMYENVYRAAQSHYAGDISVVGYDRDSLQTYHLAQNDIAAVFAALHNAGLAESRTVMRTLFGNKGLIYFNGDSLRLKYVIGLDWDRETIHLNALDYAEPPLESPRGEQEILISAPAAAALGIRRGDRLFLETETRRGQKNAGEFTVTGIVNDSTIFGYHKVYISRTVLNRLLDYGADDCSTIGLFLENRGRVEAARVSLLDELSKSAQTGPLVFDRDELSLAITGSWKGVKIFVLSLPVYLSEVSDLLNAMNILTYFLYVMMLLIIFVSAAVTYRLILHERARELGTMRVIGFYEADVIQALTLEAVELGLVSLAAGFVFARLVNRALGLLSFSWFPGFEIFLQKGRLSALYLPETTLINTAALFAILLLAVWFPAFKSSRNSLPNMLTGGAL
ncbi:MAG: ABC transporter permease [Treponema sp.]|jgi:ABC-type lipoprotein release transport system permease subunit|nr:ABC transporter permease [Treponema sp.]